MNAIASDTINLLKDFFVNYPDDLYIFIKHLYAEHDAGWFTYFIGLCIFFYLMVYAITHIGSKKYKTRDALKNIAYETKSRYAETKKGEKITDCRYSGRIFEIDNSNPKLNPYFEISCPVDANVKLQIEQGFDDHGFKPIKDTLGNEITKTAEIGPLLKDLLDIDGEMDIENGKMAARICFYKFADDDESVFIDEQKIYGVLDKLSELAVLIEDRSSKNNSR